MHPAIVLLVDSKLRLCGVFLHAASHWVPGKGNCGRGGCARSTPQPGTYESGIWECEADVAIELSEWGGESDFGALSQRASLGGSGFG